MRGRVTAVVLLGIGTAAALSGPAWADAPNAIVFTAPVGSLAGPPVPLLSGGAPPNGTIRSTIAPGTAATSVPAVLLLQPERQSRAYVIPTSSTASSLPGVVQHSPQVIVPPAPVRGVNPVLMLPALLQSALPPGTYIVLPVH